MKTAIILHGMPDKEEYFDPSGASQSNKHWLPWIQNQLILKGILAQTPEFPEPYEPKYQEWCQVFDQFQVNEDTMLIGHSLGGGFLVRWLSEHKVNVGKVILVAPFLDPDHDEISGDFFSFTLDADMAKRTGGIFILVSNDDQEILTSVEQIQKGIPGVEVRAVPGKGHFVFGSMKTEVFPELLEAALL